MRAFLMRSGPFRHVARRLRGCFWGVCREEGDQIDDFDEVASFLSHEMDDATAPRDGLRLVMPAHFKPQVDQKCVFVPCHAPMLGGERSRSVPASRIGEGFGVRVRYE